MIPMQNPFVALFIILLVGGLVIAICRILLPKVPRFPSEVAQYLEVVVWIAMAFGAVIYVIVPLVRMIA